MTIKIKKINIAHRMLLAMILTTMDVPEQRLEDWQWLNRNLGIRNQSNPRFKIAKELITFLISEK